MALDEIESLKEEFSSLPEEERERMINSMRQQCVFCLISSGKIPSKKIYEDENHLAVLDIYPASKGHILLFPKKHIKSISEFSPEIFSIAKNLALVLKQISKGVNIFIAEGELAGQKTEHMVVHIIPRYKDDKILLACNPIKVSESELDKIREDIISKVHIPKPSIPKIIIPKEEPIKKGKKVNYSKLIPEREKKNFI